MIAITSHRERPTLNSRKSEQHAFDYHGMKKGDFIPAFNEKLMSCIRET
jgi:hypothetical protein